MESHEERLHNMIKQTKMEAAADQARAAATTINEKRESAMVGIGGGNSLGDESGMMQQGGYNGNSGFRSDSPSSFTSNAPSSYNDYSTQAVVPPKPVAKKGMSLMASGGKNKSLEDALYKEDKLAPVVNTKSLPTPSSSAPVVPQQVQHPIMLALAERVSAKMTRDGNVESMDIKGSLTLTAADDEAALCSVQLTVSGSDFFTFVTHPKVNKGIYDASQLLQLKDTNKGFPSARPVGILRWNYSSSSEDLIPIKINCWPEEEARGQMNVSIEYSMEQNLVLHDVRIRIPLGTSESPNIVNVDGSHRHNSKEGELIWEIDMIDAANKVGSLEFTIQQRDADAFFPIMVDFSSPQLYCNVEVSTVRSVSSNGSIQYGLTKGLSTEDYSIV
tara:strand:- start:693 stop:1856 length:1164 start_codon:yes stop_codon:yes gene_type:complete